MKQETKSVEVAGRLDFGRVAEVLKDFKLVCKATMATGAEQHSLLYVFRDSAGRAVRIQQSCETVRADILHVDPIVTGPSDVVDRLLKSGGILYVASSE